MEKIKQLSYCYGCGVCAASCPKSVIDMKLSSEGFYQPFIVNEEQCTHCGLCEKVCSYLIDGLSRPSRDTKGFVVYSKNTQVLRDCSSGGIGFEIAGMLIQKGYKACGVEYSSANERAEHFVSDDIMGFEPSKGSKYLQSYSVEGFKCLKGKDRWVIFGTPCQIDSLVRWAQKMNAEDRFIFVDFFCHGVPSYHLWYNYLKLNQKKYGPGRIESVKFRDKRYGHGCHSWAMSFKINGKEIVSSKIKDKDLFYSMYFSNQCLNRVCYEGCKYKSCKSSADIRIGDLWSSEYPVKDKAMSAVFANTHRGEQVIEQLSEQCVIEKADVEIVAGGQMVNTLKMHKRRGRIVSALAKGRPLKWILFYMRVMNKVELISQKLFKGKR